MSGKSQNTRPAPAECRLNGLCSSFWAYLHNTAWYLTEIEDIFGNKITLQYTNENAQIVYNYTCTNTIGQQIPQTWTSNSYARAVRISKIKDTMGRTIKFIYTTRNDVPTVNQSAPPYEYAIHYSTQGLEHIEVWDKDPDDPLNLDEKQFQYIKFDHNYSDVLCQTSRKKLLLTSIQWMDPADPLNSSKALPPITFTYTNTKATLETVTPPEGGTHTFQYDNKTYNGEVVDYKLISKTVNDKIVPAATTTYSYGTLNEVTIDGLKYYGFNQVTENLPTGYGSIKHYFDITTQNLIGTETKTEYKSATVIPQTIDYNWEAIQVFAGKAAYHIRTSQRSTTLDGVIKSVQYAYNSSNGIVNEMTETNTDGSVRKTKTTYAFEITAYTGATGVDSKHMLSQVAQQTVYITAVSPSNARSSSVTTWKEWPTSGTGKWAPEATYNWLEASASSYSLPSFNFTSPPGDAEWIKTSKVRLRDGYGNILEAENADDTVTPKIITATKWGHSNSLPIATINNAKSSETSVVDFEDGTFGDWNDWFGANGASFNISHTGEKGWYQDGTSYKVLGRRFDDTELSNNSGKYTVSGWVKASSTAANLLWFVVYNNGSSNAYPAWVTAQGLGTWEYLESTLDLSQYPNIDYIEVYARNSMGTPQECYWDDLRFYPASALVNTTAYNPKTFVVTAQSDPTGMTSFRLYDGFGRPMANKNTDEKLLSSVFLYFSRDGNSGNFSSSDPNYVRNVVSQSDGLISDFADGTASGWTANSGTWAVGNGVYTQSNTTNTNTNSYRSCTQAGKQYYRWKISFIGGANRAAGMHVMASDGSQSQRGNSYLIWQSNAIMQVYETINNTLTWRKDFSSLPAQTGETHVYEVLYDAGRLDIWRDGKYVGNWTDTTTPLTSGAFISLRTNTTHASFDEVMVQGDPAITVTFSDGLGREIQRQTWNGAHDIIAKTTYNTIGLVEKQFKPQEISNPNHAYYSSLTGVHELFEYFDDPLGRLLKQTHSGGGSWITYAYGSAAFNIDPNSYTIRYVQVTDEETSPGSKISKNYFDKFGRQVGSVDAVGTADSIKWVNDYDILGNVKTMKPPNYWSPPSGTIKTDWDLLNAYDTFGRLLQKETPDEGITKFVYDNNGNLRYSQDAHQADPSRYDFTVHYYDAFNRISFIGEEYDDYSWSTAPPSITNTTYGTDTTGSSEWKIKYTYDANQVIGVTNYCQGKLTKTKVNDDSDNTTEHTTLYVYDKLGNLTDKRITIDGGTPITEKIIRHSYDLLGRETQLTYPSGNVIARQYDPVGRLKKIYTIP